ncbi:MAG: tetratricopeptide repeat protein [Treponema sp.]|nr:tetratricopeptide repeat protein [Treponema sp.]
MKVKAVSLFFILMIFTSCGASYNSIKRMQKMEEGVSNPTTKEELTEAISKFDRRAMDLALTDAQIGIWYKILGTRYLDEAMYGKALECFQKAVVTYPNNANLYYYIGICAGYMANTCLDYDAQGNADMEQIQKKLNYMRLSEEAYLRALSIDPKYYRAMYGIGVLYVFQLKEYEKAIPYLEKFLETQKRDTNAMFVLAGAYYSCMEFEKAIQLYDKIIEINPNPEKVNEATANKKFILDLQPQSK